MLNPILFWSLHRSLSMKLTIWKTLLTSAIYMWIWISRFARKLCALVSQSNLLHANITFLTIFFGGAGFDLNCRHPRLAYKPTSLCQQTNMLWWYLPCVPSTENLCCFLISSLSIYLNIEPNVTI
ncbi:hypothetical protein E2542_SST26722 [Spatholobus suberectus]|nr:hypothetical protein E2542_SST26722 [Spatholobus suberectus]